MRRPPVTAGLGAGLLGALLLGALPHPVALAAPAEAGSPTLRPVEEPAVKEMEPAVREQLAHYRELVIDALQEAETDPRQLLVGYARLGQLYLLYGFERAAEDCFANARVLAPQDARWSYYLGVSLERQGRHEDAAREFERVLEARPGEPATLLRLGWIELQRGRPDRAERWFRQRLEAAPDSAAALFGLGQVELERENWTEAARLFRRTLDLQPGASAVHYPLGLALRQLGDLEGAREHLTQRGDRAPAFPDPLVTDLDTLATGAWHHLDRGRKLMQRGDLQAALAAYRAAVEAEPSSVQAHKSLAHALASTGDLQRAAHEYRTALELEPDQPGVHQRLGSLLVRSGKLEEGIHHLEEAVELAPDFAEAYSRLATALERAGRTAQALEAANEVLRIRPDDSRAHLERERLRLLTLVDPGRDAERQLREHLEEAPGDAMARLALGTILDSRGAEESSLEAYRALLGLEGHEPIRARAHTLVAEQIMERDGLTDEATSHLRSATRLAPDLPTAHLSLARALGKRGEHAAAIDSYRQVLTLEPTSREAHRGLVEALVATGRREEARAHLREAIAVAPGDPVLRELLRGLGDETD